ncbi:MAG: putative phosphoribosyltransferase [Gammaproteobacteria bacterium]|jgi:adenine phosphoribosyltransferase|nr:putative phosphoribosyltransferase [Gammaproteobacteria bacterium]
MLIHTVQIAGLTRDLPLFEVASGVKIAVLNIMGDVPLIQACADAFAEKLAPIFFDFIVTPEAKSIPLAYALAVKMDRPFVVLRKSYKSYMGDVLQTQTISMTTGQLQQLILDEKDKTLVSGKKVLLLDDVVSTGSTLNGMRDLMKKANATICAEAAIMTEGDQEVWTDIISLGHLPVFTTPSS